MRRTCLWVVCVGMVLAGTGLKAEDVMTEPIRTFGGHTASVNSVAFSPDGTEVLTGSFDDTAKLWETATGNCIRTFSGYCRGVSSVAFSRDGTKVLTGGNDATAKLWEAATGLCLRTFIGHTNWVTSVAFSPDAMMVLTGGWDQTPKLWETATGNLIRTFIGHTDNVWSVAFSPDGTKVLTGSNDNTAKLWETATGNCIRTFTGHTGPVYSVGFSPDGTMVLTGGSDDSAKLWETATGNCVRTFSGHTSYVWCVAFSPDGTKVLTGARGPDNTAKLWDVSTGACIRTFSGHTSDVMSVAFSPDGGKVLTGSYDCTAKLWQRAPFVLTVVNGTGSGYYDPGATVPITAEVPSHHFGFDRWTGSPYDLEHVADLTLPSTTVTMPEHSVTLTGTFVLQYALTVVNGTGSAVYDTGAVVPIAAQSPPPGYRFDRWTGDTANVANVSSASTTITMLADATVTATFAVARRISGTVWDDLNGNATRDTGEAGLQPWVVYLDQNLNGKIDPGESSQTTDSNGCYAFTDLGPGSYIVAHIVAPGWMQTHPATPAHIVVLTAEQDAEGIDFGCLPRQQADVNGDGCVNVADLLIVRNRMGQGSCK